MYQFIALSLWYWFHQYSSIAGKVEGSEAFDTYADSDADDDMLNYVEGLANGYAAYYTQFSILCYFADCYLNS